jgi:hypothetical protein
MGVEMLLVPVVASSGSIDYTDALPVWVETLAITPDVT